MGIKNCLIYLYTVFLLGLAMGLTACGGGGGSADASKTEWHISTLAGPLDIWELAAAIDQSDNLHILYGDYSSNSLYYLTNKSGQWISSLIETGGFYDLVSNAAIIVDSRGNVHVVYWGTFGVKYASNENGTWSALILDKDGAYPSIALDSSDKVHIAYILRENDNALFLGDYLYMYATNAVGNWAIENVSVYFDGGNLINTGSSSIAVDSNDEPHITFAFENPILPFGYDLSAQSYEVENGEWGWVFLAEHTPGANHFPTTIDINDNIHSVYWGQTSEEGLVHAMKNPGLDSLWVRTTIANPPLPAERISIAAGNDGRIHASYIDLNQGITYATNKTGSWSNSYISATSDANVDFNAVVLDSDNRPHILYYDLDVKEIRHATR